MAGGQLVPHVLPNGQTIMVPGYLAPKPPALAMPTVQAPDAGPDQRLAYNGGGAMFGVQGIAPPATNSLPVEPIKKAAGWNDPSKQGAMPGSPLAAEIAAAKPPEAQPEKKGGVDPSTVVIGRPQQAAPAGEQPGSGINPGARLVAEDQANRPSGGGGPRRSPGLEVGSIKEQWEPGKELLPEQKWDIGLEARPRELYEVDPDAQQSTWGTEDTGPLKLREKQTAIEKGAHAAAKHERKLYELQVDAEHKRSVAEREQLVGQSNLLDEQLGVISDRRNKIARLQETAEQRAQEAESMHPRTREQVWGSKGNVARGLAVLSAVLGGLAGNDGGWKMIDKSINEAVDDDRYEAERRAKLGLTSKNDYEHALTLYGDPEMAALDTKNRKLANMAAMAKSQLADPGLDPMAKERAVNVGKTAYSNYLEGVRQLAEGIQGRVLSQEVNYKQAAPTGGGAAPKTRLQMLKEQAEGAKAYDTIIGADGKPKLNPTEQAELNNQEAGLAPLKDMLARYKGADTIPGVAPKGAPKRALRGAIDWVGGEGSASSALDSAEERANRQTVQQAALEYRNRITGAGGSAKELADINEAFAGAFTRADLENVVRNAEQVIAERRRLSGGGASSAKAPAPTPSTFRPE